MSSTKISEVPYQSIIFPVAVLFTVLAPFTVAVLVVKFSFRVDLQTAIAAVLITLGLNALFYAALIVACSGWDWYNPIY